MVSRRGLGSLATLAIATIAAPSLSAPAQVERPRVSIAVGGKGALHNLPLTVAHQLGFFADEGLSVVLDDQGTGPLALQAMLRGTADVCSSAFEQTILQQAEGRFIQAFVMQGRAPQIALGVSNKTLPGFKTLSDLKGKRIGVTALGSSTYMVASLALARAGLSNADVSYLGVGTANGAIDALRDGLVDAVCNTDPVMTVLEQKGDVRIVLDTRTLKGTTQVFGGLMPASCLIAQTVFLTKNPAIAQALANGIVRGLKWLQFAGPSDLIRTVPDSYLMGDRALYLASFNKVREALSPDGVMSEEGPKVALRVMAGFDASVKPEKIALARTYTNDFARKAKEKFKA